MAEDGVLYVVECRPPSCADWRPDLVRVNGDRRVYGWVDRAEAELECAWR